MNRTPLPVAACPEPIDRASASDSIPKGQPRDRARKPPVSPLPAGPEKEAEKEDEKEDEAADPVGDGHSDAELAERLSGQNPPEPGKDRHQD